MQNDTILGYRLSPRQKRLWSLLPGGGAGPYLVRFAVTIEGEPDGGRLRRALRALVSRHEILRTTFHTFAELSLPVQVIEEAAGPDVEEFDLSGLDAATREAMLRDESERLFGAPFDLGRGPLLRLSLIRLSDTSHELLVCLPALCADQRAPGQFARQLAHAYAHGGDADFDATQYADFAEWHNDLLEGGARAAEDYWSLQPDAAHAAPRLAGERRPDASLPFEPRAVALETDAVTARAVEDLAHALSSEIPAVMLACWAVYLWHVTREPEIVVAASSVEQKYEELREAVGAFAEYLPVGVRLSGGMRFESVLARLGERLSENARWQEFYVRRAAEESPDAAPLAFGFDYEDATPRFDAGGLTFAVRESLCITERFKLRLSCLRRGDGLRFEFHYDPSVLGAEQVERIAAQFSTLLGSLSANPAAPIEELEIVGADERRRLLFDFNDTRAELPDVCAHELFEEQARQRPEAAALRYGGAEMSYGELDARATRLAALLRESGVGAGSVVGVHLPRGSELVVALLGVWKAGGAYLPLDPSYPAERLRFMLEDAAVSVALSRGDISPRIAALAGTVLNLDEEWERLGDGPLPSLPQAPPTSSLAYVLYTSGSTGAPKGVMLPHRALVNYLLFARSAYGLGPGSPAPCHSPLGFDLTVTSLWAPLASGGVVELLGDRPGVEALAEALSRRGGYGLVKLTPAHLRALDAHMGGEAASRAARAYVIGGEALTYEALREWRAGGTRLVNEYGPTEAAVGCCWFEVGAEDEGEAGGVGIGRPVANARVYVVDGLGRLCGAGVAGELLVGGEGLARGYLKRPGLTAEKFVPDPFSSEPGARLYRTGDLARFLAGGELEYLGRMDEQVKVRGYRIELGEIEAALSRHACVRAAAVVAREETDGGKRLVAYVVAEGGAELKTAELRSHLGGLLPEYMVPSAFVTLDALPLNANGKVDRKALPAWDAAEAGAGEPFAGPRTLAEEVLCEIWEDVLEVGRAGVNDNFFALGGDSILSIQVAARAQQRGLAVTHQDIFRHQTIRELAAAGFAGGASPAAEDVAPFSLVAEDERRRFGPGVSDAYPLSRLQAGMVFHSEYTSGSAIFNDIHSIHLRAPFDAGLIRKALERQIETHAILRTSFDLSGGEPLQLVHESAPAPITFEDLSGLSAAEQDASIAAWMEADKRRRYDWSAAPLMRCHVHQRGADSFQFTLSFHHAILDGWSAATLLTDLLRDYWLLLRGEAREAEPPAASYRDFIAQERAALGSEESARYWAETLGDATLARLPRSNAPAREGAGPVGTLAVAVPREVSEGLKRLARSLGVPVKSVLLAAHCRVLGLLSGQQDVVTGYTAHGRPEKEGGERVLGLFLNALPLRVDLGAGSWAALAQRAFEAEREAQPHRLYPMAQIKQDLGGRELFEAGFTFLHYHVYERLGQLESASDVQVLGWESFEQTNFALLANFNLDVATSSVNLTLTYDTARLDEERMRAVGSYYEAALAALAFDAEAPHERAQLLAAPERRRLTAGRDARREFDAGTPVHTLFERQAARTPERVALTFEGRGVTYRELNESANRVAHRLVREGVGPDSLVGLHFEPSFEMLAAVLGVLKAGGAYVPLDPAYPAQRLAVILEDSRVPLVLTVERLAASVPAGAARVLALDSAAEGLTAESGANPAPRASAQNLCYVIYTSGSTGRPKGVQVTHANVVRLFEATREWFGFGERDVWTLFHSYAFDFSVWEIWGALLHGGRLVVVPYLVTRSPEEFRRLLSAEGVTVLNQTPSAFNQLARADEASGGGEPLSLRHVIFGGEALNPQHLRAWFARHGDAAPRLVNMYGITETTVHVTYRPLSAADLLDAEASPVGVTIPDLNFYLLDAHMNLTPEGVTGELYVGGAGLARGYLGRGDLTAERFVPDPFSAEAGARLYKTGDLARLLPDGGLDYVGRADGQVKVRGHRIELKEIEAALAQHPAVSEALVVAREDEPGERRLVAYYVASKAGTASAAELREHLKERLPRYMVPSAVVELDALPMTANGKVDRRSLPAPEAAAGAEGEGSFVAPRTPYEEVMARLWSRVLGVGRVGASDNFFDLGGHSLLATQLISAVRETFRVELPIRALFEAPSLSQFAREVEAARLSGEGLAAPPVTPAPREARSEPSFAQRRLWFLHQLDPASPAYNLPFAVRLSGALDVGALSRALDEVVRRHESLRTTFAAVGGQPVQVIAEPAPVELPVLDLSTLDDEGREERARALSAEEAVRPFDLAAGPLLRVRLVRLAEESHLLLLTMHHIVSDGWSMQVLVGELTALYSAFSQGRPSPLAELPVQYADYAAWQREVLSGESLRAQLSYWRAQLAGLQTLNLPLDRPRHAGAGQGRSASEGWTPPEELSARLYALAAAEGATTYMVLLAAFQLLLGWYSGQEDVAVGTDIANRHRAETEGLIGFFVNQLVLRTDLSGDPTFAELVGRVRRVALDAYAHQELPFEKLTEALNPDRGNGLTPLFQVKLVMQNAPAAGPAVGGLALSSSAGSLGRAKFDLLLNLAETGRGVAGALEYNADVFDAKTVRQLLEDYTAVLDAALDEPRRRLSTIHAALAAAADGRRLLEEAELEALRERGLRRLGRRAPLAR